MRMQVSLPKFGNEPQEPGFGAEADSGSNEKRLKSQGLS